MCVCFFLRSVRALLLFTVLMCVCLSLSVPQMSVLSVSVVLVGLYILCRVIPWLVQSNATLALLWYDYLLEMTLDLLTQKTRPQVTPEYVCSRSCPSLTRCLTSVFL